MSDVTPAEPAKLCPLCPRLVAYREANTAAHPDWFNGAVPSFGDSNGRLAIVGLAPGVQGANRTGRPFTGDFAGELLYGTLIKFGFARGRYEAKPDDGLTLVDCIITNAVRCVPPENKPLPVEIAMCRRFLGARLTELPNLRIIVALGRIAHESVVNVFGLKQKAAPFGHGAKAALSKDITLFDSFHCSRYNTNTGKLTTEMFESVFNEVRSRLGRS
jgi:uracil-DNA glycosylase